MNLLDPTILIVDDEPDLRDLVEFHVSSFGYRTKIAASGNEAIEIVRQEPIQIVISDVRMPDGCGVEMLKEIRKIDPLWPRVFFVTGHADVGAVEAFELGAEAYFSKPICYRALKAALTDSLSPVLNGYPHRQVRVQIPAKVELAIGNQVLRGELHNFSSGGMFVELETGTLPLNEQPISFCIEFSKGEIQPVRGISQVKWMRPQADGDNPKGFGMIFTELPDDERYHLIAAYNEARVHPLTQY